MRGVLTAVSEGSARVTDERSKRDALFGKPFRRKRAGMGTPFTPVV
jgi:hypothetical protein